MDNEKMIMGIIIHGGQARSSAMKAMEEAGRQEFLLADEYIKAAEIDLVRAHQLQTNLIQAEARGEKTEISLLTVHAQDHLMNAMTVKDLAFEIIKLNKKLSSVMKGEG